MVRGDYNMVNIVAHLGQGRVKLDAVYTGTLVAQSMPPASGLKRYSGLICSPALLLCR
jgi:hypothetical protein